MKFWKFVSLIFVLMFYNSECKDTCMTKTFRNKIMAQAFTKFRYSLKNLAIFSKVFYQNVRNLEACPSIGPAKELPNAKSWLSLGYDIMKGNPLIAPKNGELIDPGFRNDIFKIEFSDKTTTDGIYYLPKGYEILPLSNSCTVSLSTDEYETTTSLKNDMKAKLGVSATAEASVVEGEFSANIEYVNTSEKINTSSKTIYSNSATCVVYKASVTPSYPPGLEDNFVEGLRSINKLDYNNNKKKYFTFMTNFGTHYLQSVFIGSKFIYLAEFSKSSVKTIESNGVNVGAELKATVKASLEKEETKKEVSTTVMDASAQAEYNKKWETQKTVSNAIEEKWVTSVGSPIPTDLSATSWLIGSKNTPMPVSYELAYIYDLLKQDSIYNYAKAVDLDPDSLYLNLKLATTNYCKYQRDELKLPIECETKIPLDTYEYYTKFIKLKLPDDDIFPLAQANLECPQGQALSYWSMKILLHAKFFRTIGYFRMHYKCVKSESILNECTTHKSKTNYFKGGDKLIVFKKHTPKCEDGYVLNRWQPSIHLDSDNSKKKNYYYFDYTCCKANLETSCTTVEVGKRDKDLSDNLSNLKNVDAVIQDNKNDVIKSWKLVYKNDGNRDGTYELEVCPLKKIS